MSWKKRLESEKWVVNQDIPDLIARAEELQEQERDREEEESSSQDVHRISQELNIEDRFMEQALEEYKSRNDEPTARNDSRFWVIPVLLLGVIILIMMLLSVFPSSPKKEHIVERESTTKIIIQKEIVHEVPSPVEPVVIEKVVYVEKATIETKPAILSSPKKEVPIEIIEDVLPVEENKERSVEDTSKDTVSLPPPLSPQKDKKMKALFMGKWVLVSYLLLDDGEYMEVPITPSPLALVENWSVQQDTYRRVLDTNLSFSAHYSFLSSPFSFDAIHGHNFLVHAQKVHSSIPGIRRSEEFFHGEITEDTLVLWYLGASFTSAKQPTQGHKYERK